MIVYYLRISLVCLSLSSSNHILSMDNNSSSNSPSYFTPIVSGIIAGWAYESFLYRLPYSLGLPATAITAWLHIISSVSYTEKQGDATIQAAFLTAAILYLHEKETVEEKDKKHISLKS